MMGPMMIAIIPVKERSRRFPGKNFSPFMGTNLILHAVNKLLQIPNIETIYISTDVPDKVEAAITALGSGKARVIIGRRPAYLAEDTTPSDAVVSHVLDVTKREGVFVYTQITTPNWTVPELKRALDLFRNKAKWHDEDDKGFGSLVSVGPGYRPNGAFYITTTALFKEAGNKLYHPKTHLFTMPTAHSVDINHEWDLRIAEALARQDYT